MTHAGLAVCLVALVGLGACNPVTTQSVPPSTVTGYPAGVTPSSFRLPEGEGCKGEVARFRAIIDNDLDTGHINQTVHGRIVPQLDQAGAACSAGRSQDAIRQVQNIRSRFGYPAS